MPPFASESRKASRSLAQKETEDARGPAPKRDGRSTLHGQSNGLNWSFNKKRARHKVSRGTVARRSFTTVLFGYHIAQLTLSPARKRSRLLRVPSRRGPSGVNAQLYLSCLSG